MSLDIRGILAAVESHALATGRFDSVYRWNPMQPRGHEPTNMPGHGITCAIWLLGMKPHKGGSGLAATTVRLEVAVTLHRSTLTDPPELVDVEMTEAAADLFAAYHGDFTLDGVVRNVDLLGESGGPLEMSAGELRHDEHTFRTANILLPLILNDVWAQSP